MVDWVIPDASLSIKAQAVLLSVNRTSLYRKVKKRPEFEAYIKNLIDVLHTEKPFKGSRRIRNDINDMNLGFRVNRKRIQRYMRDMGTRVIFIPAPI